jgi:pimeloyl-ACP methyl ester carboxylesterase
VRETALPKVILIHGNGGSTAGEAWYPWVARECGALGLHVINETFPDNVKARARIWLPHLEELGADENTILIGHSSGAVAAMRYAETHRLRGSILVGVCHTDLGDSGEAESGVLQRALAMGAHPREPAMDRDPSVNRRPTDPGRRGQVRRRPVEMQLLRVRRSRPLLGGARVSRDRAVPRNETPLVIDDKTLRM